MPLRVIWCRCSMCCWKRHTSFAGVALGALLTRRTEISGASGRDTWCIPLSWTTFVREPVPLAP